MSGDVRSHSPAVRAQAERLGVDLDGLDGTGVGGRVRMADVLAAAKPQTPPPAHPATDKAAKVRAQQEKDYLALFGEPAPRMFEPARPSSAVRRRPVNVRSAFTNSVEVTIDAAGPNPLLEDVAQSHPCYPLAIQEAEPPTVFNTGNLPPFLASGLPPETLLELPWEVRHYAAGTESRAEVLNMVEMYAADLTVLDDQHKTSGMHDYVRRMEAWLIGPGEDTLAPRDEDD